MSLPPSEPTYTVFIRLPFARRGFIDPPPVDWDSSKDDALWAIVSSLAKTDIDWNDIAAQFHVTVDFLLQHVAWLTDRHASQVRAQMRRAQHTAPTPTPTPTPASANQQSQQPQDVTPTTTTTTTTTSTRATPRPPSTRTSSTNTTVFTARNLGASTSTKPNSHSHSHSRRRRLSSLPITTHVDDRDADRDQHEDSTSPNPAESSSAASSSSTDDDDESSPAQSRIIRRPPQNHDDDDDDDDTRPAFLPYRQTAEGTTSGQHDLSATLRGNPRATGKKLSKPSGRDRIHHSQTSDSSTGSTPLPSRAPDQRPSGPLSPRRTMELSGRSSGAKGKGYSRDSDDTPSMGSSFSDLDDASVTQSALEEALASNMQDGGTIASLRGTIGNAFRSRYQTKGQQR
ncbi:hypothetical protein F5Y18DRAFT_428611 [Xylariaceae sp. FL1019]|nr:hypothetical protein F5Y18DRAFT_428611 [Xylariaceae sp. FL1019]